jgi:hypothetical protein
MRCKSRIKYWVVKKSYFTNEFNRRKAASIDYCDTLHTGFLHRLNQNFSLGGGGGADPEAIHNLFHFKNYVMQIMSNFPSRHLVRLQGKLKLTAKVI